MTNTETQTSNQSAISIEMTEPMITQSDLHRQGLTYKDIDTLLGEPAGYLPTGNRMFASTRLYRVDLAQDSIQKLIRAGTLRVAIRSSNVASKARCYPKNALGVGNGRASRRVGIIGAFLPSGREIARQEKGEIDSPEKYLPRNIKELEKKTLKQYGVSEARELIHTGHSFHELYQAVITEILAMMPEHFRHEKLSESLLAIEKRFGELRPACKAWRMRHK